MEPLIIEAKDLSFSYVGRHKILDSIDMSVRKGAIYGFLGDNGAGKTTTIKILLGLYQGFQGRLSLFGKQYENDRLSILGKTAALIETPSFYPNLSGRDNLRYRQCLLGLSAKSIDRVLGIVKLEKNASRKVREYSLGMKQRLGLGMCLMGDPELLILDEPTNGLDPSGIKEIRELILKLNKDFNKTIFLSSHLLSEIEKISTDIGILDKGKLSFQGSLSDLKKNFASKVRIVVTDTVSALALLESCGYESSLEETGYISIKVKTKEEAPKITRLLVEKGAEVHHISSTSDSLEEMFMDFTKK